MRFGIAPYQWDGKFEETLRESELAEKLGYDSVWILEHHFTKVGYYPAPLLTLAAISTVTSRIKLGTAVLLAPFRNPVQVAEEAAMVHVISGGRLILGLGTGYRLEEFRAFGADRKRRIKALRETVMRAKELWSGRDVLGRDISEPLSLSPGLGGLSRPHIWVGGYGESSLAVAAELGDAWFPGPVGGIETLRRSLSKYKELLDAKGKDWRKVDHPLMRDMYVAPTSEEAKRVYSAPLIRMYEHDYGEWGHRLVEDRPLTFDELRDRCIVGSPSEVIEQIEEYRKLLGIDLLICRTRIPGVSHEDAIASMKLARKEVVEALAD